MVFNQNRDFFIFKFVKNASKYKKEKRLKNVIFHQTKKSKSLNETQDKSSLAVKKT